VKTSLKCVHVRPISANLHLERKVYLLPTKGSDWKNSKLASETRSGNGWDSASNGSSCTMQKQRRY